jgi:hypothetical protein
MESEPVTTHSPAHSVSPAVQSPPLLLDELEDDEALLDVEPLPLAPLDVEPLLLAPLDVEPLLLAPPAPVLLATLDVEALLLAPPAPALPPSPPVELAAGGPIWTTFEHPAKKSRVTVCVKTGRDHKQSGMAPPPRGERRRER